MPGVLVEVTSPALIEKVRSTTTRHNGQYRITNLPVGTYSVTFTLEGFTKQQQDNVVLTTGFTAPVNATMTVGQLAETVTVTGETPTVDVQNARQASRSRASSIRELPTARNVNSLLTLTPGSAATTGLGADCVRRRRRLRRRHRRILQPGLNGFNVGQRRRRRRHARRRLPQGRVMVDGDDRSTPAAAPGSGA